MENMKVKISDLRKVKGIGAKTIERIKEQFDEIEYISEYDESIHIESNSLVQGDMLEVMNGISDKSVDMILTDLPYGTTACSWDSVIDFDKMWKQYNRVIKENGVVVLFGSEPFSTNLRSSNIGNYRYDWIWKKRNATGFQLANKRPMKDYELISVFYKKQPKYNPQGLLPYGKVNKRGGMGDNWTDMGINNYIQEWTNYPRQVLEYSYDSEKLHSTQKPLDLIEYLIKTYTNEGDLVLDSTMGSGITCLGAKNLGRKYIGIELDEEYFSIAKERVNGD